MTKPVFFVPAAAVILFSLALLNHCSIVKSDANLISSACKHTPNYNLCIQYLNSDPRSSNAKDVAGLSLIMVDIIKTKSIATVGRIKQLLVSTPNNPQLKKSLSACTTQYNFVLTTSVPEAVETLQKGNPKFAEDGVVGVAREADSCEHAFKGNSPLTNFNKVVHDLADIARQMIRLLL